ncbi:hypothetical protein [Clostridium sp. HBUAS56010]|uniref:hypothetical protein n=1 Tax=Clostridium sp. HBUAS56010 TaxID=2571127 RepID=UPI001178856D|nr:hypothetical protein [Clostridium sp. HBUAS56010]
MNLVELIEERLSLKVLLDFGTLLPRSVMVEEISNTPGVVGNGKTVNEVVSYNIVFAYADKTQLDRDTAIIKTMLIDLPNCSLPECDKSSDPNNKKWLANISFQIQEGDN